MRLRFGELTFDGRRRQLLRGAEALRLSPKAFSLLELLLSRRPEAVSKEEIHEVLWPRTFVSESNLPALVAEVRKALGDSGRETRFVRTVHSFGYAFEAETRELSEHEADGSRRHSLHWGRLELVLGEGANVLGRDRGAEVRVGHPSVSRRHARLTVTGDAVAIEDLDSKNGTFVGTEPVRAPTLLHDGDEVRVGSVLLVYRSDGDDGSTISSG